MRAGSGLVLLSLESPAHFLAHSRCLTVSESMDVGKGTKGLKIYTNRLRMLEKIFLKIEILFC